MKCSEIKVIKKDGTKEEFNVQKVLAAVNKSANRAMIIFSKAESKFICEFVEEKAEELDQSEVPIAQMHNIVEGALERVNPVVAKSYRDYRNYLLDTCQVPGGFYAARTRAHALRLVVDMMLDPQDPYAALEGGHARSRQQMDGRDR